MKAECIITDCSLLPMHHSGEGYTRDSVIALKIGKVYEVFATSNTSSTISLLVMDEDEFPRCYPAEVFKIIDDTVPNNWFFRYFPDNEFNIQAIWGPERLVRDDGFNDALMDRNPTALHLFHTEVYHPGGVDRE